MLFAPIACYYFSLRSKLRDQRAQFALIVPEVTNLSVYTQYRQNPQLRNLGFRDFYTSSLGDAGLRFLSVETNAQILKENQVKTCQVLTLGTVAWSKLAPIFILSLLISQDVRIIVFAALFLAIALLSEKKTIQVGLLPVLRGR